MQKLDRADYVRADLRMFLDLFEFLLVQFAFLEQYIFADTDLPRS
jgi:hypothetical protein